MRIEFVGGPHDGLEFDVPLPTGQPPVSTTRFPAPGSGRDHEYEIQWTRGRAMYVGATRPEGRHGRQERDPD
jgi:hypothetical protein